MRGLRPAVEPRTATPWVRRSLVALPVLIVLIGGWSHRWVADDAYIDIRVVGNVLSGHGPVFNVGERVEVFTNPIWVGILAAVRGTLGMLPTAWWAVLLDLAATASGVALSVAGSARLGRRRGATLVVPAGMLCLVCLDVMWDFATSGLETGLIFLWLGALWWLLVRRLDTGRGTTVLALLAGLADGAYVVLIGGDFMHGRMLLPGLFLVASVLWLDPADRLESLLPIGVAAFCLIALVGIRYPVRLIAPDGIANERSFYIASSGSPHPISMQDYRHSLTAISGRKLSGLAVQTAAGTTRVFVYSTTPLVRSWDLVPGKRIVPARLVAPADTIGINGITTGSRVYLFDLLSLANPIGSHLERPAPNGRPGHNDPTPLSWMVARFVPASSLAKVGQLDPALDAAERAQLACPTMGGYLHAITAPLTASVVLGNLGHALTWTTLRIPAHPGIHSPCPS